VYATARMRLEAAVSRELRTTPDYYWSEMLSRLACMHLTSVFCCYYVRALTQLHVRTCVVVGSLVASNIKSVDAYPSIDLHVVARA
jgi:hypothetical protein